jgi:hypothetical protein
VQPSSESGGKLSVSYLVQVEATTTDNDERRAATSFLVSFPRAQLTGRFTDRMAEGNLVVAAEVAVSETGRFHLEATLYNRDGTEPVAWAQTATTLEPGTAWMELPFYGLVLRERGIDGPYLLRQVALSTTTEMPNAKNRVVENAHRTRPYVATSFSDRPFNDPGLLEAADRLERSGMPRGLEAGG